MDSSIIALRLKNVWERVMFRSVPPADPLKYRNKLKLHGFPALHLTENQTIATLGSIQMVAPMLNDAPAEGSREVVERELNRLDRKKNSAGKEGATADDILRLLGELDAARVAAILALAPALTDIEQAAVWLRGEGDILAMEGQALAGKAAAIFDIASSAEDIDPD